MAERDRRHAAALLPATAEEMKELGWLQADFVLVTGDAYVDHPSFGAAIVGRLLEKQGYKVAVLAQPDWRNGADFKRFGRPRLGFLITSGCVDSMVNNYSVMKRRRKKDAYSPGGVSGKRPDRAVVVYANKAREAYKGCPVILGGLEASLRRLAHYDYWSNSLRRSILLDSKADLLIYGMGERAVVEVAAALNDGFAARDVTWVAGTTFRSALPPEGAVLLPGYDALTAHDTAQEAYVESFKVQCANNEAVGARPLAERYGDRLFVIQNPPQKPLSPKELDETYELPFTRRVHPLFDKDGGVPAAEEVRFSITANRGCFGNCAFCALAFHQGRLVVGRSKASIVNEAKALTAAEGFKGYIHDVGGPTANFRKAACSKQESRGSCQERDCLFPEPCARLDVSHDEFLDILRAIRALPKVKKVFIRSGVRHDYLMADPKRKEIIRELCAHHVSGILKVAPEHASPRVLTRMRKPSIDVYESFAAEFRAANKALGKNQYLLPYFISAHPGSGLAEAVELALFLRRTGFVPEQAQDYYPSPGTAAACMYYAGTDPFTGEDVYVARSEDERRMQRALLQFNRPENRRLVLKALKIAGFNIALLD
jgi:uncharacterized radical SAM protein YgiQ